MWQPEKGEHGDLPGKYRRYLCRNRVHDGTPQAQKLLDFLITEMGVNNIRFPSNDFAWY
jgi:hypothetical protein